MTRNVVAKFGGTSVRTASAIRQVTKIIKANKNLRAVVVSAVGVVTNIRTHPIHI
jgi:aspartokinase